MSRCVNCDNENRNGNDVCDRCRDEYEQRNYERKQRELEEEAEYEERQRQEYEQQEQANRERELDIQESEYAKQEADEGGQTQ